MIRMKLTRAFLAFAIGMSWATGQQSQPKPSPEPTIRTTTQEVLLDLVVRDKKGKPVRDLTASEIEISDDGVPQQIRSFRLVKGAEIDTRPAATATPSGTPGASNRPAERAATDATREIRLITIAVEGLGQE